MDVRAQPDRLRVLLLTAELFQLFVVADYGRIIQLQLSTYFKRLFSGLFAIAALFLP